MSRMRRRSTLWSRAGLLAYYTEGRSSASPHERRTFALKRSCIQAARSRRLTASRACPREVGNDAAKSRVLVLEHPELAQLADAELGVLFLRRVEGRLRDADLPAHGEHRRAAFSQPQRE